MPSGKNAWLTFLTFDLLIKIVILHALLAVSMPNILLVVQSNLGYPNSFVLRILYCVRISEFVQITEVVAKISRKRLV